jgi:hypothetical protein
LKEQRGHVHFSLAATHAGIREACPAADVGEASSALVEEFNTKRDREKKFSGDTQTAGGKILQRGQGY